MVFQHKILYNKPLFFRVLNDLLNSKAVIKIIVDGDMIMELISHQKEDGVVPKLKINNDVIGMYEEVEINSLMVAIHEILLAIKPIKLGDSELVLTNPN